MYLSGQYFRSTSSRSDGLACSSSEYSDESESFWGFLMSSPRSYLCGNQLSGTPRHRRDVVSVAASARWRGISRPSTRRCPRGRAAPRDARPERAVRVLDLCGIIFRAPKPNSLVDFHTVLDHAAEHAARRPVPLRRELEHPARQPALPQEVVPVLLPPRFSLGDGVGAPDEDLLPVPVWKSNFGPTQIT